MKKRENKLTNAQTIHDASFGPVVVVAAFYVMYSVSYNLYLLIKQEKIEENLLTTQTTLHWHALFGPMMVTRVVGRWLLLVVVVVVVVVVV